MADLDRVERRAEADMAALFWWRRVTGTRPDGEEPALLDERLVALAERAAPPPRLLDLPRNRLKANAELRRARETQMLRDGIALQRDVLAALRDERRNALVALTIALIATAAPVAAAIYAAILREPVALGFAIAGGCAASFALYHAARWFLLMRADTPPNFLA
jgi:hypothetical protein